MGEAIPSISSIGTHSGDWFSAATRNSVSPVSAAIRIARTAFIPTWVLAQIADGGEVMIQGIVDSEHRPDPSRCSLAHPLAHERLLRALV